MITFLFIVTGIVCFAFGFVCHIVVVRLNQKEAYDRFIVELEKSYQRDLEQEITELVKEKENWSDVRKEKENNKTEPSVKHDILY